MCFVCNLFIIEKEIKIGRKRKKEIKNEREKENNQSNSQSSNQARTIKQGSYTLP